MKLAITYDPATEEVFQHFGKTQFFKVYDIEDDKVVKGEVFSTNGQGHGALAGVLQQLDADVLVCGGIGGGARNALGQAGIQLFGGVAGRADDAAAAYARGALQFDPDFECHDHDHDHDHGDSCHHEGHTCC